MSLYEVLNLFSLFIFFFHLHVCALVVFHRSRSIEKVEKVYLELKEDVLTDLLLLFSTFIPWTYFSARSFNEFLILKKFHGNDYIQVL